MKKVALILFLLYAKSVSAQHLYYFADIGYLRYSFREAPNFNSGSAPIGIGVQYIFKDSSLGLEGNFMLYTTSPYAGQELGPAGAAYTLAPYFFIDPAPDQPVSVKFKLGFMYSHYFALDNSDLVYDIGPSPGLFLYFRIGQTSFLGFDFSAVFGQRFYSLSKEQPMGSTTFTSYSSQLNIFNFSLKLLFR